MTDPFKDTRDPLVRNMERRAFENAEREVQQLRSENGVLRGIVRQAHGIWCPCWVCHPSKGDA